MPLPANNSLLTPPNPSTLTDAVNNHPAVTAQNSVFLARYGNAAWNGNRLDVAGGGVTNYWYIPAVQDRVSYCVVPCGGGGTAYVISDQYGGCEYHELYNATLNMLAFLHVYRGGGATTQYTPAAGWALRSVKRSAGIVAARGTDTSGSNMSVSCIDPAANPPTVQTTFVNVGSPTSYVPPITLPVRTVNAGDDDYGTLAWRAMPLIGRFF